jgi:hypothetical protein
LRLLDWSSPVLFSFLKVWRVKHKILQFFSFVLRHMCVMTERKLTGHRELHLWPLLYRTLFQVHFMDSRNQGFPYYFCLMIEGSRPGSGAGSGYGSIPLTNGSESGSRRPKNTWIRIRIGNTAAKFRNNLVRFFFDPTQAWTNYVCFPFVLQRLD